MKGLKEYIAQETGHLDVHTMKVTSYKQIYSRVNFEVFDSGSSSDLAQLNHSEQPDAIVFTLKMDDVTLNEDDLKAIQSITKAFGWRVWKHAMFILAFANRISKPGHSTKSTENTAYFNKAKNNFKLEVMQTLKKFNVESDVADRIPFIPIGLVSGPFIEPDGSGSRDTWMEEFLDALFEVLEMQNIPEENPDPHQQGTSPTHDGSSPKSGTQ